MTPGSGKNTGARTTVCRSIVGHGSSETRGGPDARIPDTDRTLLFRGVYFHIMVNERTETEDGEIADTQTEIEGFDSMIGIALDGVIGALGGLVGTAAMTVGLLVAQSLGAFDMVSFADFAELVGIAGLFPANAVAVGYLVFLGGGMVIWPLLFAAAGLYLPGETYAKRGLPYGFVLWTGFAPAFYLDYSGFSLVLYLVLTLIAHFSYGFSLGAVFDYFTDRPDTLV